MKFHKSGNKNDQDVHPGERHCEDCGSEESNYIIDPYEYELIGVENWRWLCSECENNLAMEI